MTTNLPLAQGTSGELLVAYIETDNFANALGLFSGSQDDFDLWFKRRLADSTGVDLNTPPEMSLPELLSELRRGGAGLAGSRHQNLTRRQPPCSSSSRALALAGVLDWTLPAAADVAGSVDRPARAQRAVSELSGAVYPNAIRA